MLSATADRSTHIQSLLLIDRDPATGTGLDACWAPQARPAVIQATSGRQAVAFLRGMTFEIVLADLNSILDLAAETDEAMARLVKSSAR